MGASAGCGDQGRRGKSEGGGRVSQSTGARWYKWKAVRSAGYGGDRAAAARSGREAPRAEVEDGEDGKASRRSECAQGIRMEAAAARW